MTSWRAKMSAKAVRARSPPERDSSLPSFFPRGRTLMPKPPAKGPKAGKPPAKPPPKPKLPKKKPSKVAPTEEAAADEIEEV